MSDEIRSLVFKSFLNQAIPFEIVTIKELYDRCKDTVYNLYHPHRIQFNALIIITEGESFHTLDFKQEPLSPGVVLPLAKGQVHFFRKELKVKGYVISFDESFITENISEKNLFHFLHLYHSPSVLIGREDLQKLDPFIQLLRQEQLNENLNLKVEIINAAFLTLMLQIKKLSVLQHKTFESQRFKDFLQFKKLLSENYQENHSAEDYAKMLSVSYKYLNDICKDMVHKTAKTFIDEWLLLEIKRNIAENRYTSKEIAYRMGFNEPSNFIRFFKKYTGTTPNKFQAAVQS